MGNGQIRTKKEGNSNRFQKNEFIPNRSIDYLNYKKWSIFLYILQEKVKTTPITIAFSDYTGPQDYHPSIQYIARKFKEQKKSGPQAYCHLTCITDTNNMRFVINAVTDLLIKNFLKDCGIY